MKRFMNLNEFLTSLLYNYKRILTFSTASNTYLSAAKTYFGKGFQEIYTRYAATILTYMIIYIIQPLPKRDTGKIKSFNNF